MPYSQGRALSLATSKVLRRRNATWNVSAVRSSAASASSRRATYRWISVK